MKAKVRNDLAVPPLIYVSSVINTLKNAINEINNIIQNVIWDGLTSKISQQALIQSIPKGGLKLCHLEAKVKALNISGLKDYVFIMSQNIYNCKKLNILCSGDNILPSKNLPSFYRDIHNIYMKSF